MPKSRAERGDGPPHEMVGENFLLEARQELSPEERVALREFFRSTAWAKTVHNARIARPSTVIPHPPATPADVMRQAAAERLAELRGWKQCEVALAREIMQRPEPRPQLKDNYTTPPPLSPT